MGVTGWHPCAQAPPILSECLWVLTAPGRAPGIFIRRLCVGTVGRFCARCRLDSEVTSEFANHPAQEGGVPTLWLRKQAQRA